MRSVEAWLARIEAAIEGCMDDTIREHAILWGCTDPGCVDGESIALNAVDRMDRRSHHPRNGAEHGRP